MTLGKRKPVAKISLELALTDPDRKTLKRLLYRVLDANEADRRGGLDKEKQFRQQILIDDHDARVFLRRLG